MTKRRVIILSCVSAIVTLAAIDIFYTLIFPDPVVVATEEELAELRQIEKTDPEVDAMNAVRQGDWRLLSVLGFSESIPVAKEADLHDSAIIAKHGRRAIKGTTDYPKGDEHARLQPIARKYAERYNAVILRQATNMVSRVLKPAGTLEHKE